MPPELSSEDQPPQQRPPSSSYEEIALSAYFIALERARRGEEGDPLKDWVDAEREHARQGGTV